MNQPPINHHARNHHHFQASNANRSTNNYNRTGRAVNNNSTTWLDSLPLYDTSSWEGQELLDHYGHHAHVCAQSRKQAVLKGLVPSYRGVPSLRFYIPPQDWWRNQASAILDKCGLPHEVPSMDILLEMSHHHMEKSAWAFDDIFIPNSLPTTSSHHHTNLILYSALTIELVRRGINQPLPTSRRILDFASQCYDLIADSYSKSRGINSNTFVNVAIDSAQSAGIKFQDHLHQREMKEMEEKQRQANFARELQQRKARHKQASDELWAQYRRKQHAATVIFRNIRRIIFIRRLYHRLTERRRKQHKLTHLCRGASAYAHNIKASRPPRVITPPAMPPPKPNNPKATTHPFRDRNLPLPKRRRRQRHRRTRHRPPRKLRGGPIIPSPSQLKPSTQQHIIMAHTIEAHHQPSSTASPYSPVPSQTERVSTKQYHINNKIRTSMVVVEWPLCFWAAQSMAAKMKYDLGFNKPVIDEPSPPPEADTQDLGEGVEADDTLLADTSADLQRFKRVLADMRETCRLAQEDCRLTGVYYSVRNVRRRELNLSHTISGPKRRGRNKTRWEEMRRRRRLKNEHPAYLSGFISVGTDILLRNCSGFH